MRTDSELSNLWRTFPSERQRKVHELVCEFRLDPNITTARRVWAVLRERRFRDVAASAEVWERLIERVNQEINDELRKAS